MISGVLSFVGSILMRMMSELPTIIEPMLPSNRQPTHPGEILEKEFLQPLGLSRDALAEHVGASKKLIDGIIDSCVPLTADVAWRLAQALETTPEFWMNLQNSYDLASSRPVHAIARLRPTGS